MNRVFSQWASGAEILDLRSDYPDFPKDTTLIVELSGKDSVFAALIAAEKAAADHILPTAVFVPTEYGDQKASLTSMHFLAEQAKKLHVLPLAQLSSPRLWSALSGRFLAVLGSAFGMISPCIGCRLYLHSLRIQLARKHGLPWIAAGEREDHGAEVEVNQEPWALGAYRLLAREMGVELLLPLRKQLTEKEISRLTYFDKIEEYKLKCPFSGSDRDEDGKPITHPETIGSYLREFALPLSRKVINCWASGFPVDPLTVAADILRNQTFQR